MEIKERSMLLHDIRHALRLFTKNPAFVAMAVLALAFGIGANSVVFSFLNAFVLRPLPSVDEPSQVVMIEARRRGNIVNASYPDFEDWRRQSRAFARMAAIDSFGAVVTGRGEPERLAGARVTPEFFDLFTARPALGRLLTAEDYAPSAPPVMVIVHRYWQRAFGGRSDALGAGVTVDGVPHTVIGILPVGFRYSWEDDDFFSPLLPENSSAARGTRRLDVMARLKQAVPMAAAQTELNTIARRLEIQYPETNTGVRANVRSLISMLGDGPDQGIYMLMGVVGFVLLIACANVANLHLARATAREGEMAVRTALGAGRGALMRLVLTESTLVALTGGIVGIAFSWAGARLLIASLPASVQPLNPDFFDGRVFAFTAAVALMTGIVAGIAPALRMSLIDIHSTLKEAGRSGAGSSPGGLRSVLVVAEVSLAIVLLLAAGLLIRSFHAMQQVNPGFRAERLLTAQIALPQARYPKLESRVTILRDLVTKISAVPGVRAADAASTLPMVGGSASSFVIEGRPSAVSGPQNFALWRAVTSGYFETMGIPIQRGRAFTEQDTASSERVAIINERMSRTHFPNEDPIGKRIKWSKDPASKEPWMTIVGVSGEVRSYGLGAKPVPEMFAPLAQKPPAFAVLAVRTWSPDPLSVTAGVRTALHEVDRDQPITNIRAMQSIVDETLTEAKYVSGLTALFAAIAMVLAVMGIYGVISYSVARRTHELGIRMVLGAGPEDVFRLVLRQALTVVSIGLVIGVAGALAVSRVLSAWLYGVSPRDPLTFIAAPVALAFVALVASYIPARRATRVDPAVALRCE
jgi:putative ABC transport system permease protein